LGIRLEGWEDDHPAVVTPKDGTQRRIVHTHELQKWFRRKRPIRHFEKFRGAPVVLAAVHAGQTAEQREREQHLVDVEAEAMTLDEPANEGHKVPSVLFLARIHVNIFYGSVLEECKALSLLHQLYLSCRLG
jgi:hypothetical protein